MIAAGSFYQIRKEKAKSNAGKNLILFCGLPLESLFSAVPKAFLAEKFRDIDPLGPAVFRGRVAFLAEKFREKDPLGPAVFRGRVAFLTEKFRDRDLLGPAVFQGEIPVVEDFR